MLFAESEREIVFKLWRQPDALRTHPKVRVLISQSSAGRNFHLTVGNAREWVYL